MNIDKSRTDSQIPIVTNQILHRPPLEKKSDISKNMFGFGPSILEIEEEKKYYDDGASLASSMV